MNLNRLQKTITLLLAAAFLSSSAHALIVSTDVGAIISAPATTANDANVLNQQQGFNEKQGVLLATNLLVDGGFVAAGTLVNSHMIFLDIGSGGFTQIANWTFDGTILGVMSDLNGSLESSSNILLGATGTTYGSYNNRGLEDNDDYVISGNQLNVTMRVSQPGDWIRVITLDESQARVPDTGATAALMGLSFLGLLAARKRFAR